MNLSSTSERKIAGNSAAAVPGQGVAADRPQNIRRISIALFLAGFATFSLLYCVQPLLPEFARHFGVSPATSSLSLSLSTGFLAVAILCAAVLSEGVGRRGLMFASMAMAAGLNIVTALAPDWHLLLFARAAEGFVLGGVPAVAMTYLAEEIAPEQLGLSMGVYVAGTAFGGMIGRVATGMLAEYFSWRLALTAIGIAGLLAAAGFMLLLPPSRNFVRRPGFEPGYHLRAWEGHLRHAALPFLFAIGFLAMGTFVTIYNYAGFRLMAPPYRLDQTALGLIFAVYVFGIAASSIAGTLAGRIGRGKTLSGGILITALGLGMTAQQDLPILILGIVALTIGFFITHSVASGWVGRLATHSKGHASSLYLLAYYLGSSVAGSAGGWFWSKGGWNGVVLFTLALLAISLAAAWRVGVATRAVSLRTTSRLGRNA
jgi:MFS transporter, YNFM family, putative membrane transport protein